MQQVKKRNGSVVDFTPEKITLATRKAFLANNVSVSDEKLEAMTEAVVLELARRFPEAIPGVEDVQDIVENILMAEGFHDVAKAYIIYRYEHTKIREQKKEEVIQQIEERTLSVVKRNGKKEIFSLEKIEHTLKWSAREYESEIDIQEIVKQCQSEVYDGITTAEVTKALIMVVRSMIELDPAYSYLAARLTLNQNYKEVIGPDVIDYTKFESLHQSAFIENIKHGVSIERLDARLLDFNLEKLAKALVTKNDGLFNYLGLQTLYDRYFVRDDETKRVLETPQMFWMRVAMGTALQEKKEHREQYALEFYKIMSEFLYTPSTPTLFHAGTAKPQLSSCYLNMVPDSLDEIFKSYSDNAQLSKYSGGIGTAWTHLRATGSFIKGTGVESNGIIPFLKIANDVTVAINRSGRRRGAACVYLENWHYDFPDFLELRKNTGDERRRAHDMDTAAWISDLFMKRVKAGGMWTFFSPDETPELPELYGKAFEEKYVEYEAKADLGDIKLWKRIPAQDLWKKMLAMLFETGHPWITWKDPSNIRSPQDHAGVIHSSNLCTEITLNTSPDETAVCNLGSLNFAKFIVDGKYDTELVASVVKTAMRMLDNVIDINFYPTEDGKRSNLLHRPVGLGVRGFHDALYLLGYNYDSNEAIDFADESMEVVSYYAILASSELAKERGTYKTYKGSKWDRNIFPADTIDLLEHERGIPINLPRGGKLDWTPVREHVKKHGMRNSNCLAIAPTATTANIVGCFPSIEPAYKNIYVKSNQAGDFIIINEYLVKELKQLGLWNKEIVNQIKYNDGSIQRIASIPDSVKARYKECFEIDPKWLYIGAARRGKWIDQSQSLNIFFRGTSGRELSDVYFAIWELGLKTTYYLRTLAASQVEKSTVSASEFGTTHSRESGSNVGATSTPSITKEIVITPEMIAKAESGDAAVCVSCEG